MGVHYSNSRGDAKDWESTSATVGATPKRGSPSPQPKGPNQSVGFRHRNSRGHARAWESIIPTLDATPKCGSPTFQLKAPWQRVEGHQRNWRGHAKAWESIAPDSRGHAKELESISPTREPTPTGGIPSTPLEGPCQSVGVHHPNSRCHAKAW